MPFHHERVLTNQCTCTYTIISGVLYEQLFAGCRGKYPERTFYLAGHSLGGGIARLVELELPWPEKLLTITFASPGVHYAVRVLFGQLPESRLQQLEQDDQGSLNVKPVNDVISLIDAETGNTLLSPCHGRAWQCHSIFKILGGLFSVCGSMTHANLTVPCGWTPATACRSGQ